MRTQFGVTTVLAALFMLSMNTASADKRGEREEREELYSVTITNVTREQTFTPLLVISHRKGASLFQLGEPASTELAIMAEDGNISPLRDMLLAQGLALDATTNGSLLPPGASVTLQIKMNDDFDRLSVAGMLIPTNDAFVALNSVAGPKRGRKIQFFSPAYDAGSEINDERCANIPGPVCGGQGFNPAGGEGYVHIHAGIHGIGDLAASKYDWRNPVARIVVERIK